MNNISTNEIITELKGMSNPANIEGMKRYGIITSKALGIRVVDLRKYAKTIKKSHETALELWETDILEARFLASMVDIPKEVTEKQMEDWVLEFNSWDICDQVCNNLFRKTAFAHSKAVEWAKRDEEFIKRAGFVLMATLAVGDKKADDSCFEIFFPLIIKESTDERNFVKKAVNWALRQIGKRNLSLNIKAAKIAKELTLSENKAAKWVGSDAYRELTDPKILKRIESKKTQG